MTRVVAICFLVGGAAAWGDELASDEQVIFFPTAARLDEQGDHWVLPIRGWVFEPESNSLTRAALERTVLLASRLPADDPAVPRIRRQLRWFLVDNERGKSLTIQVGDLQLTAPSTGAHGHFSFSAKIPRATAEALAQNGWLTFRHVSGEREFVGRSRLLPARGVAVLTDIDDTIKDTHVTNRTEMLKNTFALPPRAIPGAAEAHRRWAKNGTSFHYVSGSPWQLYPMLSDFVAEKKFPAATFDLRIYRVKNIAQLYSFEDTIQYKFAAIEHILKSFPQRRFVLIGDSGQRDPEIYGQIARRRKDQVIGVFIRRVEASDEEEQRFERAFRNIPERRCGVFDDYDEVSNRIAELLRESGTADEHKEDQK